MGVSENYGLIGVGAERKAVERVTDLNGEHKFFSFISAPMLLSSLGRKWAVCGTGVMVNNRFRPSFQPDFMTATVL